MKQIIEKRIEELEQELGQIDPTVTQAWNIITSMIRELKFMIRKFDEANQDITDAKRMIKTIKKLWEHSEKGSDDYLALAHAGVVAHRELARVELNYRILRGLTK